MPRWSEDDYKPTFGGENFGGEGGPVDWLHPGGRNPDYRRPDERIIKDIHARLMQHGLIRACDIDFIVTHGEVVLTGTAPNEHMKQLAEDVARSVWGVTQIHNQIRPL